MSQVVIFAHRDHLAGRKALFSATIHACVTEALGLPPDKRFHRFFGLEDEDFVHPPDRSPRYTIVEISLFAGRTVETKKRLIRLLFQRFEAELGIAPQDLEITLTETPKENWGIRGMPADELALPYRVET